MAPSTLSSIAHIWHWQHWDSLLLVYPTLIFNLWIYKYSFVFLLPLALRNSHSHLSPCWEYSIPQLSFSFVSKASLSLRIWNTHFQGVLFNALSLAMKDSLRAQPSYNQKWSHLYFLKHATGWGKMKFPWHGFYVWIWKLPQIMLSYQTGLLNQWCFGHPLPWPVQLIKDLNTSALANPPTLPLCCTCR